MYRSDDALMCWFYGVCIIFFIGMYVKFTREINTGLKEMGYEDKRKDNMEKTDDGTWVVLLIGLLLLGYVELWCWYGFDNLRCWLGFNCFLVGGPLAWFSCRVLGNQR